jgi:hypothetical protein
MKFTDLLSLEILCETVVAQKACLFVIGDGAATVADQFTQAGALRRLSETQRALFGLPVLTLPYPILVNSLMTEHNTRLEQLSLFGWVEDNAILEPRAEVFGLTPLGEDPVLFLRDLDLDRRPEAYVQAAQPAGWLRVAGVVIAKQDYAGGPATLAGDDGALSALDVVLPADAQTFVASLRAEVAQGKALRQVLRAHRRGTAAALMAQCDGWRVLSRAARFVLMGTAQDAAQTAGLFRLDAPRRW